MKLITHAELVYPKGKAREVWVGIAGTRSSIGAGMCYTGSDEQPVLEM